MLASSTLRTLDVTPIAQLQRRRHYVVLYCLFELFIYVTTVALLAERPERSEQWPHVSALVFGLVARCGALLLGALLGPLRRWWVNLLLATLLALWIFALVLLSLSAPLVAGLPGVVGLALTVAIGVVLVRIMVSVKRVPRVPAAVVTRPTRLGVELVRGVGRISRLVVGVSAWPMLSSLGLFLVGGLLVLAGAIAFAAPPFGLLVGPVLILLGAYAVKNGRRRIATTAEEARVLDDRPPVLILRSFQDDELNLPRPWLESLSPFRVRAATLEEWLAARLEPLGPVIAIGDPREELPPLGASRAYVKGREWHDVVSDLIDEARVVVMIMGMSEGIGWELHTLRGRGFLTKTIVVVPPIETSGVNQRWTHTRDALRDLPIQGLHAFDPAKALFVVFTNGDGLTVVADRRDSVSYAAGIDFAFAELRR